MHYRLLRQLPGIRAGLELVLALPDTRTTTFKSSHRRSTCLLCELCASLFVPVLRTDALYQLFSVPAPAACSHVEFAVHFLALPCCLNIGFSQVFCSCTVIICTLNSCLLLIVSMPTFDHSLACPHQLCRCLDYRILVQRTPSTQSIHSYSFALELSTLFFLNLYWSHSTLVIPTHTRCKFVPDGKKVWARR